MYLTRLVCCLSLVSHAWATGQSYRVYKHPLWPQPTSVEIGEHVLWVDRSMTVIVQCGSAGDVEQFYRASSPSTFSYYASIVKQKLIYGSRLVRRRLQGNIDPSTETHPIKTILEQDVLREAVRQALTDIHGTNFVPWKFHRRHSAFEPDSSRQRDRLTSLTIKQKKCPLRFLKSPLGFHEGCENYSIDVQTDGTATIESIATIGTLRAIETFKQLFYAHSSASGIYTPYVPVSIDDAPRFSHRGISLDIARNPFTVDDALRTIDAMATAKMNRLHLHATDSQSWPLEIPALPELAEKGAYQPSLVWSTQDLEILQSYGDNRGVMVYLELDMPGHTASIAHAYPELIAAYNQLDWSTFAAEVGSGQLKLNSSKVHSFLDTLFTDLLPRLTRHSGLYHLGGDEVNQIVHLLDETVKSSSKETLKPLIQNILNTILSHIHKHGLRPVVWEEMVIDWDLTLPSETLVQVWRSSERIEAVLKKGFSVIFGDYHHWYLDCGFGTFLDPYPDNKSPKGVPYNTSGERPSRLAPPFMDYCAPYHNWRDVWSFDPIANVSKDLRAEIEGGEVLMWSEQTDSVDLDFKLWPRAAAAAEVLWSGPREQSMMWDATWRLGHWRERLVVNKGIGATPVTMTWCLMEGGCEY